MATSKQNMKRIHKVTIKRMVDESPDTSWLGEYGNRAETEYAIDRRHSEDCQSLEANHRTGLDQLERVIAYLETVRNLGEPPENIYWASADESQDLLIDLQSELEECDCGERGDMLSREFRYFNGNVENYKGESPEDIRKYVRQDYEQMERLNAGDWSFIGIRAEAQVSFGTHGTAALLQEISSGGCWGIESDSDEDHFKSIEKEELAELEDQLHAIGFSKRAIASAFKNVLREGN